VGCQIATYFQFNSTGGGERIVAATPAAPDLADSFLAVTRRRNLRRGRVKVFSAVARTALFPAPGPANPAQFTAAPSSNL
jgi:hypothetical protein